MAYDELKKFQDKDHDLLIALMQLTENHMKSFDLHVESFREHVADDRDCFKDLRKDNLELQKVVWKVAGIVTALQLMPAIYIVFKFFNH